MQSEYLPTAAQKLARVRALADLDRKRMALRSAITAWAEDKDGASTARWTSHIEHHDLPNRHVLDVWITQDCNVLDLVQENETSFYALFEGTPFWFDFENSQVLHVFLGEDSGELHDWASDRLQLEWWSALVAPDIALVYDELFQYFAVPSRVSALGWRQLEQLVASAYSAQGMTVKLGPGHSDEGIDLHVVEHAVYGDLLTTVQVKSGRTPIRLAYVQALAAATELEDASRGLFVTSSRFLPGVRRWTDRWNAARTSTLQLATAGDVAAWCDAVGAQTKTPADVTLNPSPSGSGALLGRVLTATNHVRFIYNTFGLVVRQTANAVLMRRLDTRRVAGDLFRGAEVPVLEAAAGKQVNYLPARLSRSGKYFWGDDGRVYSLWDGEPTGFDHLD